MRAYLQDTIGDDSKLIQVKNDGNGRYTFIFGHKTRVIREQGVHYVELEEDKAPDDIKPFVEYYSDKRQWRVTGRRVAGLYQHKSAEGELVGNGQGWYFLTSRGSKIKDVKALYRKIRVGTIYPSESFEEVQVGPPLGYGFFMKLRAAFGR